MPNSSLSLCGEYHHIVARVPGCLIAGAKIVFGLCALHNRLYTQALCGAQPQDIYALCGAQPPVYQRRGIDTAGHEQAIFSRSQWAERGWMLALFSNETSVRIGITAAVY